MRASCDSQTLTSSTSQRSAEDMEYTIKMHSLKVIAGGSMAVSGCVNSIKVFAQAEVSVAQGARSCSTTV